MTAAIDITTGQRKTLLALLRRYIPGVAVWAYGSRVKWTARPNSDLDLVAFTSPEQQPLVSELKEALAESDLPFLVDFHVWDDVPERFHEIIRKEYVVLQEAEKEQLSGRLLAERKYIPASEFCTSVRDGTHDSPKPVELGRRLVTSRHITGGRLELSEAYLISDEDFEAINKRSKVDRWDVLISMIGTVGEPCLIKDEPDFAIKNIGLFKTKSEADGKWLYYYLRSAEAQQSIREQSRGTTQQYIPLGALRDFQILIPDDPAEKKAIAHILGTLDDKIELNRRMNATLETMARTLFQNWFVDFDPVRAKLDGRQPAGLDSATAALFPAHFQESPLGHIPQGWTVEPVGDVVECVGGGTPSTAEPKFWEGGTHHWTTPKDFSSLQAPILLDTDRKITDAGVAKISSGLLPAGTLLLSSRAPVGYLAIAAMSVAINQGFIAIKCNERASNFFMLNWCQANMAEIESRATGTTFAEISKTNFRPILVVLPPKELMAAFTEKVAPLYAKITANVQQSRTLATIRDVLLPKLLSGELSVTLIPSELEAVI